MASTMFRVGDTVALRLRGKVVAVHGDESVSVEFDNRGERILNPTSPTQTFRPDALVNLSGAREMTPEEAKDLLDDEL